MLKWIKTSFQGKDNKASSRKITAFILMCMFVCTWFANLFYSKAIDQYIILGLLSLIGLTFGYVTAQNIVDIFKNNNIYPDNYTDIDITNNKKPSNDNIQQE